MEPYKKAHLNNGNQNWKTTSSEKSSVSSFTDNGNSDAKNKKIRKRRTLSETSKRDFRCGCGKNYVSYPAIYLHIQRKHDSVPPPNTVIPEKPEAKDKVKRGRPKKEKNNMLDIVDADIEIKYKTEDNFWLYLGMKGLTFNEKSDNRFINNLEAPKPEAFKLFPNHLLSEAYYQYIRRILHVLDSQHCYDPVSSEPEIKKLNIPISIDRKLAYFILWISNPLREDIFQEMCMIICFVRRILLDDIWFEKVGYKSGMFSTPGFRDCLTKVKNKDVVETHIREAIEKKRFPVYLEKWNGLEGFFNESTHTKNMESLVVGYKDSVEELFKEKLGKYTNKENTVEIDDLAGKINFYKDKDLLEKSGIKFHFVGKDNLEDLKGLIVVLTEWMLHFDENEGKIAMKEEL